MIIPAMVQRPAVAMGAVSISLNLPSGGEVSGVMKMSRRMAKMDYGAPGELLLSLPASKPSVGSIVRQTPPLIM